MKPNPQHRGDPLFLADVLRFAGVNVVEADGWRNRGHGDFDKIQGIIVHHTGANNTSVRTISHHPELGLCSQIHLSRTGVATITGAGIAYHAGKGWHDGWPTNAANFTSIGIEAQSDGVSPWPQAQLEAYYTICAAILWYLGKDATKHTLLAHWEYSMAAQGKWDPGSGNGRSGSVMDMDHFRREVQTRINQLRNNPQGEDMLTIKYFSDYIQGWGKAFFGPQFNKLDTLIRGINDARTVIKDVQTQLRGPGNNGWSQLGKNQRGQNLTLVDSIAALRQDVARLEAKVDKQAVKK